MWASHKYSTFPLTHLVTITNQSDVPARLILDLRQENVKDGYGIDCLSVRPSANSNDESSIMKSIDNEHEMDDEREEYILFFNLMQIV